MSSGSLIELLDAFEGAAMAAIESAGDAGALEAARIEFLGARQGRLRDLQGLERPRSRQELETELTQALAQAPSPDDRRTALNAFKDSEMFRVDMRHILGRIPEFSQFSEELSDVAEVTVAGACRLCLSELLTEHGEPRDDTGHPCPWSVCALGKCGGRELGFASDIELMFVYQGEGKTRGPQVIGVTEFYIRLVEKTRWRLMIA
jgi:glutamate-ammonia-ligase adenylyltransferase